MKLFTKYARLILSFLHGIVLFIVVWLISNSPYTSAADEGILEKVNALEASIFNRGAHKADSFVFINVSKDQKLVADPADYGDIPITNRARLAGLFKILADNGNRHKFVLCDIFFEHPDEDDSLLTAAIKRCSKLLFPCHITADTLQKPCIEVPVALSDFVTYTGNFSKFKLLYHDTIHTMPIALLNAIDHRKYPASFLDFRSIFPQYYIRNADLAVKRKYPYYNLGELLMLAEIGTFYSEFLENKFIVIGNFDTDIHHSPVGNMAGPLIVLDTYLSVRNKHAVSWWWAIFMVTGLTGISYILFYKKIKPPDTSKHLWLDLIAQVFINNYISFSGICLLLVLLSSFIFSIQLNISLLLSYLLLFNFIREFYKKHRKKTV